jgi:hypothetical protein
MYRLNEVRRKWLGLAAEQLSPTVSYSTSSSYSSCRINLAMAVGLPPLALLVALLKLFGAKRIFNACYDDDALDDQTRAQWVSMAKYFPANADEPVSFGRLDDNASVAASSEAYGGGFPSLVVCADLHLFPRGITAAAPELFRPDVAWLVVASDGLNAFVGRAPFEAEQPLLCRESYWS